ncbi:OmpA family protein [uncultured Moraxella sp.]|uniref:OmpA family protein n=1 Tax=uncultured Moraxella sp. TaxID=263769 RepID=UPI0025D915E9|nr:OmpA family protein [uncultured Moraxella sp.]
MNLFEKLNEFVTPYVLAMTKDVAGDSQTKSNILSVFYPLFTAYLSQGDAAARVADVSDESADYGKAVLDAVMPSDVQQAMSAKLAQEFGVSSDAVSAISASASAHSFAKIEELAGGASIAQFAKSALTGFNGVLPAWASSLLPAGALAGGATLANSVVNKQAAAAPVAAPVAEEKDSSVAPVAAAAVGATAATAAVAVAATTATTATADAPKAAPAATHVDTSAPVASEEKKGGFLKSLLPIIGLLIFAGLAWLLLRSCQDTPAPVAAPVAKEATAGNAATAINPAVLGVTMDSTGEAIASCTAQAGSEGLVGNIRAAIAGVFTADKCELNTATDRADSMAAEPHLPALLGLIKGVPNATLGVADKAIRFGGADDATVAKLVEQAKGIVPADFDVQAGTIESLLNPQAADANANAAANADAAPATVNIAMDDTGNAVQSCRTQVGAEDVVTGIKSALSTAFGADACQADVAASHAATLPAAEQLPAILGVMKGVPNASVSIVDKTIRFNAADEATVAKLVEAAKAAVPADFTVEAEPKLDAAAATASGNEAAKKALEALTASSTAEDLVKALNLQIINFASGKSDIPADNKAILDLAVAKMAEIKDAGLQITGHTDSQGNAEMNKKLSESRANAVRDYLVSKGVDASRLATAGMGPDQPVASNATEQGRFQNRRIEFAVKGATAPTAQPESK